MDETTKARLAERERAKRISGFFSPAACKTMREWKVSPDTPSRIFEEAMGGEIYARTLADVAKAFGVSLQTAKAWMSMGAPGKEPSGYSLPEILCWRLIEDQRAEARQQGDTRFASSFEKDE